MCFLREMGPRLIRVWENNRFSLSSRLNPSLNVFPSCFASIKSERERSTSFHCNIHSDHEAFSYLCSVVSRFGYLLLLVKVQRLVVICGATYVSQVLRRFLLGWFTIRAGNRISARSMHVAHFYQRYFIHLRSFLSRKISNLNVHALTPRYFFLLIPR